MISQINTSLIIFVNDDLSDNVKEALQRQLYINSTMTGIEFDLNISENSDFLSNLKIQRSKVLVIRSFTETTNRDLADIVIFVKNGLASILKNNYGPPGTTLPVDKLYLNELLLKKND